MQTIHASALLSPHDTRAIEDILQFWIGEPARDGAALEETFRRWFASGATLDRVIEQRFGHLVQRALAGELDRWRTSARGRIALVVLLDQFPRNVFRGTPKAYAGDPGARELSLEAIGAHGIYRLCSCEQRLVFALPLAHSESVEHQRRSVELAHALFAESPEALRPVLATGIEHAEEYLRIIERFGRFPHRNVILGRTSTSAELLYLAEKAAEASAAT